MITCILNLKKSEYFNLIIISYNNKYTGILLTIGGATDVGRMLYIYWDFRYISTQRYTIVNDKTIFSKVR